MTSVTSSASRVITDSPVVVALDYNKRDAALAFVDGIDPRDCRLKVGKEMFTLFGPQIVRDLQQRGFDVFLDLKYPKYHRARRGCCCRTGGMDGQCSCIGWGKNDDRGP